MPYIVVNHEQSVLSRASPNALLSWIDLGVSRATDYRYAIIFETFSGADKCAKMQGGEVRNTGRSRWHPFPGAQAQLMASPPFPRVWPGIGMGYHRTDSGLVEVET